jgi:hypothetical protein
MNRQERTLARSLIASGQGNLFRSWPRAGTNDAAKRQLLASAAGFVDGAAAKLEEERLGAQADALY